MAAYMPQSQSSYIDFYADGDTLVTSLPDCVDHGLYQSLNKALAQANNAAIRTLLLDCTLTRDMTDAGHAGLRQLGREARAQDIRVLLLDPDHHTRATLARLLPQAEFIDP